MPLIYAKIIQRKMVNTNNKHKRVVDQYLANTERDTWLPISS